LHNTNINPVNIKSLLCTKNYAAGQKLKYKYKSQVKEKLKQSDQLIDFSSNKTR
jgi:hypothetical protein